MGIALIGAPLRAHDLWIAPTSYTPGVGQNVGLHLLVGEQLSGEALPLIPALVKQFVVADSSNSRPVSSRRGGDPAGVMRVATQGLQIVGYHGHPSRVELAAEKFNAYLVDEGLDAVAATRASRNETGARARELFSRCAKSLLLSGPPSAAQRDRPLGCALELVAEANPYALRAGQALPLRLSYESRALAGALVVALNSLSPREKLSARTDAEGRVRFVLRPSGVWLIKAVHMVPAPEGTDADWASYWASLTFALQGAKTEAK